MKELAEHFKEEKFAELKSRLKACQTQAEQNAILAKIETKKLNEFSIWLQRDGAAAGAIYMTITGLLLKRG